MGDVFQSVKYLRKGETHPVIRKWSEFEADLDQGRVQRVVDFYGEDLDALDWQPIAA